MHLPRKKGLITIARNLRKNATKEEKHLWYDFLANYPIRFRRQEIIGPYIADFYCDKVKLVIELDGGQHFEKERMRCDKERTRYFESLGIRVIRFTNIDVLKNLEGVCLLINREIKSRL